jgi:hypothetical protein
MEKIYVVARPEAGYAREDPSGVGVVGAYTAETTAQKVKRLSGVGAEVKEVPLDVVPPGFLKDAAMFGICFDQPDAPTYVPADWDEHVHEAWACLSKHNHTIPNEVLDQMKALLLSYPASRFLAGKLP